MEREMKNLVCRFLKDQSGASSIEYAMLASVVSIVIIVAVQGLGSKLKDTYTTVDTAMN